MKDQVLGQTIVIIMTRLSAGGGWLHDTRLLLFSLLMLLLIGRSAARQGQRDLLQIGGDAIPDGSARPLEALAPTSGAAAQPSAGLGVFGAGAPLANAPAPAPARATETLASGNETTRYSNGTCSGRGDFSGTGLIEGSGLFISSVDGATIVGKDFQSPVSNVGPDKKFPCRNMQDTLRLSY